MRARVRIPQVSFERSFQIQEFATCFLRVKLRPQGDGLSVAKGYRCPIVPARAPLIE